MADLFRYEQLRLTVERLLAHPSFPSAQNSSFADAISEVQNAMSDLQQVPMRRSVQHSVTPASLLHEELTDEEYARSTVILTRRRGPERRGPGYEPGQKRRKSDE